MILIRHIWIWSGHKPHILLHNSFLLSFWKYINKIWNGADLELTLWAMGENRKRGITGNIKN